MQGAPMNQKRSREDSARHSRPNTESPVVRWYVHSIAQWLFFFWQHAQAKVLVSVALLSVIHAMSYWELLTLSRGGCHMANTTDDSHWYGIIVRQNVIS